MKVPFNDLGRDLRAQSEDLTAAFGRVRDSGWLVHGPEHSAFEQELAEFLGVPSVVGVASGTDALALAFRAATTLRPGAVLTAANAGGYAAVAARAIGVNIRWCDVDPDSHLVTRKTIEAALTTDVSVVVVTHLYGRCADVAEVVDLCHARGVLVVEDCAQAIGASGPGGVAGSFADLATFSFYPTKNLGALGDGGAVACATQDLADQVRTLRQYGWSSKYRIDTSHGTNSRLDELQAAFLRLRLPSVLAGNERRRGSIARYAAAAPRGVRVLPAGDGHAGHLAVLETDRADLLRNHLSTAGIGTDVHYPVPDHHQPGLVDVPGPSLPVTESLVGRILTLPCFPRLTDAEIDHVCSALASYAVR